MEGPRDQGKGVKELAKERVDRGREREKPREIGRDGGGGGMGWG